LTFKVHDMSSKKRILKQPTWILHQRPYRDTSCIIDIFTRDLGRVSIIAKGGRSPKSKFRGLLRPFFPMKLSWYSGKNLGNLVDIDVIGKPYNLIGDSLLSAYYLNELILKFLVKDDPQVEIFDLYSRTISDLIESVNIAPVLRKFEIEFLKLIGYGLNLEFESGTELPVRSHFFYEYKPEIGLVISDKKNDHCVFNGADIKAINQGDFQEKKTIKSANRLLKSIINFHLDGRRLKTRRVLEELKRFGD
tara:strand:- start:2527 stop:3273 length:747 start_codon:yes stop_codon:yes gene_type:complete